MPIVLNVVKSYFALKGQILSVDIDGWMEVKKFYGLITAITG
jgi:hypothetical protein